MTSETNIGGLAMDPAVAGSVAGTYWFLMMIGRMVGAPPGSKFSSKVDAYICGNHLDLSLLSLAFIIPVTTTSSMPVFPF